jgi:hypothetical protein
VPPGRHAASLTIVSRVFVEIARQIPAQLTGSSSANGQASLDEEGISTRERPSLKLGFPGKSEDSAQIQIQFPPITPIRLAK